jgi:hypothetical protein
MKASDLAVELLQAYLGKHRRTAESLIGEEFRFTSPLDNAIDRATYFSRCWPNCEAMRTINVVDSCDIGETAFLVYEISTEDKRRFRNCEMHTARDGKLISIEVYFGWNLPHPAAPGSFLSDG